MGRPPKDPEDRLEQPLMVRFSAKQLEAVTHAADVVGEKPAAFIRNAALARAEDLLGRGTQAPRPGSLSD